MALKLKNEKKNVLKKKKKNCNSSPKSKMNSIFFEEAFPAGHHPADSKKDRGVNSTMQVQDTEKQRTY